MLYGFVCRVLARRVRNSMVYGSSTIPGDFMLQLSRLCSSRPQTVPTKAFEPTSTSPSPSEAYTLSPKPSTPKFQTLNTLEGFQSHKIENLSLNIYMYTQNVNRRSEMLKPSYLFKAHVIPFTISLPCDFPFHKSEVMVDRK